MLSALVPASKCEMIHLMLLNTTRLNLRELTIDDLDAIQEWQADPHTMRFYPSAFTREMSRTWIERTLQSYQNNGHGLWAVVHKESGKLIGNVGITLQPIGGESLPEIGYQIHQDFWGNGYAPEAAIACREYGFNTLNFPALHSWMAPDNLPSRRVAEKIGMTLWKETVNPKSKTLHVVYRIENGETET